MMLPYLSFVKISLSLPHCRESQCPPASGLRPTATKSAELPPPVAMAAAAAGAGPQPCGLRVGRSL